MRWGLIDMLILVFSIAIGAFLGHFGEPFLPQALRPAATVVGAVAVYLAIVYPIYRGFKLLPMILPRCPCCKQFQQGFHFTQAWPRITYRCPTGRGEFVIWHTGKPTAEETWDKPVLALKWPYALGTYKRLIKHEPATPPYSDPTARSPQGCVGPLGRKEHGH